MIVELQKSFKLNDSSNNHQKDDKESNQFGNYAEEGTGVRGGGTGILNISEMGNNSNTPGQVTLLDLY